MGTRISRNRLPYLLLTRDAEQQVGYAIEAVGVLPRKRGDREPADLDGSARESLRGIRKTRKNVHLFFGEACVTPQEKMDTRILDRNQERREKRQDL